MPNSSVDKIIFHDVEFSPPYRHNYPRYVYSNVTFSDGTEETLRVLFDYPTFTEHVKPQAGFTETFDGIRFLVSIDLKELSPLKQIKSGIPIDQIQCKKGFVEVIKNSDNSPACVTLQTKEKLMERGWAEPLGNVVFGRAVITEPKTHTVLPVESDRITFQDKSLDYWKGLDFDQLREYNSKSDRDEFYYALGELLAKEYFLEKLVELNLVNVNDDLTIHTGNALQPDPPIIGFNTVVNATDGFSYVMHTSVQGNRLGEYFNIAQLVFEPHILSTIAENKPAPFTNKFGESPTIYIVTEDGDDKLSSNAVIIDFDQTNTITFVNNSPNSVRIQEVGENKIDEIPKNSWRTKAIVPGESLTMQFNSTGFYEFNVKKITDYFPDYLEHHATGEIVVFTENMTDYTFAEGLLMGSTFIQDAPRPEIPWQSIGAGNNRGLEIGIVDSVIEAFPNAYEYYLTKAKSLIPFDVPITIEFSGTISLD